MSASTLERPTTQRAAGRAAGAAAERLPRHPAPTARTVSPASLLAGPALLATKHAERADRVFEAVTAEAAEAGLPCFVAPLADGDAALAAVAAVVLEAPTFHGPDPVGLILLPDLGRAFRAPQYNHLVRLLLELSPLRGFLVAASTPSGRRHLIPRDPEDGRWYEGSDRIAALEGAAGLFRTLIDLDADDDPQPMDWHLAADR